MSSLEPELVERLSKLAAIELGVNPASEDREQLFRDIPRIVEFLSILGELPSVHLSTELQAVDIGALRPDVMNTSQSPSDALANAPLVAEGCFVVPPMIDS
ncbi:MAG TPA: Asp-tRNA(Asn)/Glu-tRNA(Gln) amidotransferase subunit GatC [Pirellulaceae bacterium]|nr:Asp-tRNA(Asn)/Glu-tRNA(Gln) amidotransferase subunit GatC [Pirellulaceae bacterium]